jgi:hypothetical protein
LHLWNNFFLSFFCPKIRSYHITLSILLDPSQAESYFLYNTILLSQSTNVAYSDETLKGTLSLDLLFLVFFMNQFPPQPQSIPLGPLRIFQKFAEIFAAQGAPPVSTKRIFSIYHRCQPHLKPVVHLELRISPRIFEKIPNGTNGILRGLG